MSVKLLTEHNLEFLSLKEGYTESQMKEKNIFNMEKIVGSALESFAKGISQWTSTDSKYGLKTLFLLFNI